MAKQPAADNSSNNNAGDKNVIAGKKPTNPDLLEFWIKYAQTLITNQLTALDERAKFMMTTCASIIVIDVGILVGFSVPSVQLKVVPQFFFAISAAFFAFSYFPRGRSLFTEVPDEIKAAHTGWTESKMKWHKWGYAFFISGLFGLAVTLLIR